jgi:hypothetical protein
MAKAKKIERLVAYEGDDEILVTSTTLEQQMLREWFGPEYGRDVDDYQRLSTSETAFKVEAALHAFDA